MSPSWLTKEVTRSFMANNEGRYRISDWRPKSGSCETPRQTNLLVNIRDIERTSIWYEKSSSDRWRSADLPLLKLLKFPQLRIYLRLFCHMASFMRFSPTPDSSYHTASCIPHMNDCTLNFVFPFYSHIPCWHR